MEPNQKKQQHELLEMIMGKRELSSLPLTVALQSQLRQVATATTPSAVGFGFLPKSTYHSPQQSALSTLLMSRAALETARMPTSDEAFLQACADYQKEQNAASQIRRAKIMELEEQLAAQRRAELEEQLARRAFLSANVPSLAHHQQQHQQQQQQHQQQQQQQQQQPLIVPPKPKLTFGVDDSAAADGAEPEDMRASSKPFPFKLYQILEDAEKEGNTDIIAFQDDGCTFSVHNKARFLAEIVPRYFFTARYSSFKRQLNLYGFKYTVAGKNHAPSFFHPAFIKGKRHNLFSMKRKKQQAGSAAQAAKPDIERIKKYVKDLREHGTADPKVLLGNSKEGPAINPTLAAPEAVVPAVVAPPLPSVVAPPANPQAWNSMDALLLEQRRRSAFLSFMEQDMGVARPTSLEMFRLGQQRRFHDYC